MERQVLQTVGLESGWAEGTRARCQAPTLGARGARGAGDHPRESTPRRPSPHHPFPPAACARTLAAHTLDRPAQLPTTRNEVRPLTEPVTCSSSSGRAGGRDCWGVLLWRPERVLLFCAAQQRRRGRAAMQESWPVHPGVNPPTHLAAVALDKVLCLASLEALQYARHHKCLARQAVGVPVRRLLRAQAGGWVVGWRWGAGGCGWVGGSKANRRGGAGGTPQVMRQEQATRRCAWPPCLRCTPHLDAVLRRLVGGGPRPGVAVRQAGDLRRGVSSRWHGGKGVSTGGCAACACQARKTDKTASAHTPQSALAAPPPLCPPRPPPPAPRRRLRYRWVGSAAERSGVSKGRAGICSGSAASQAQEEA